ncbi:MAG: hypothetical protein ACOYNS_01320 [Bacteroidota bacterium]
MKNILLSFFTLLILLTGCAEKPKSVGNGLPNIDGTFIIDTMSVYSVKDTCYRVPLETGYSLSNLTGRISATEEIFSMYNVIPDVSIDSLKGARIDSAEFRLTINYRSTPVAGKITFNIVEIKKSWSQLTFTTDSVPFLTLGSTTLGSFNDSMIFGGTTTALIDTNTIRRWVSAHTDTNAPGFYGFAVQSPLGVNNGIVGFSTFSDYASYAPQLFIRYTKNGRRDSIAFLAGDDAFAPKSNRPTYFSGLMVQGAFGVRSKLAFDLSSLVDKPIVNYAVMELTLDTTASSFSGYSPDTVTALLSMSGTNLDQSDSLIFVYGLRTAATAGKPPVFKFTITNIVDRWARGVKENFGLNLRWSAEYGTVEKAVFYPTAAADVTKRPKLYITYSKK